MALSRREFIRASSVFAVSAGFSLGILDVAKGQAQSNAGSGYAIPYEAQRDPLFYMTKGTFTPYLNTGFTIDPGYASPLAVRLIEVRDTRPEAARRSNIPGKDCFLLAFRAPENTTLKQGTYRVNHSALGAFDLFITVTRDRLRKPFFEAVINRCIP